MKLADEIKKHLYNCSTLKGYNFVLIERLGEIEIKGFVKSYYHKQVAQEIVRYFLKKTSQNLLVKNELQVQ